MPPSVVVYRIRHFTACTKPSHQSSRSKLLLHYLDGIGTYRPRQLNTFGHCICALLVYCFWWSKPLDVEQPVPIPGEKYRETLAWMWIHSYGAGGRKYPESYHVRHVKRDASSSTIYSKQETSTHEVPNNALRESTPNSISQNIALKTTQELLGTSLQYQPLTMYNHPPRLQLSQVDVLRWRYASATFQHCGNYINRNVPKIATRERNFSVLQDLTKKNSWLGWLTLLLANVIYGGLHALAWNIRFGSHAEQVL